MAAVGVSVINGIAFGTAYTFGTFFDAMAEEFNANRSATALIFAITISLFFGFGVVSGPLSDRFGPQPMLAAGAVLFVGGLGLTSIVDQLWQGYITYGIGVGIGGGCFAAPLTGAAGALFEKRRAAALGVVAVGNGVGTLVLVPFAESIIAADGWRVAYRYIAIIAVVGFIFAGFSVLRPPRAPAPSPSPSPATGTSKSASEPSVVSGWLADKRFRSLFATGVFMSIGLLSAFAFIIPFATDNGLASDDAARILSLVGLSSIIGRLALTTLADRLGAIRLFQLMLVIQPIAYVVWIVAGGSAVLLTIFALILGVSYGGYVAISPEVAISLFGVANVGRLIGLLFLSFGIGGLIGPPFIGLLADTVNQTTAIGAILVSVLIALGISTGVASTSEKPAPLGTPDVE